MTRRTFLRSAAATTAVASAWPVCATSADPRPSTTPPETVAIENYVSVPINFGNILLGATMRQLLDEQPIEEQPLKNELHS